jgi:hypothetical protein
LLKDDAVLADGSILSMIVTEEPLKWRVCSPNVTISSNGLVATKTVADSSYDLVTSGKEMTEGRHYFEVELMSEYFRVGVTRPGLNPHAGKAGYAGKDSAVGWFMRTFTGTLYGNGKQNSDAATAYTLGDKVGLLLDLDDGSLAFFKNDTKNGPGYGPGSVTGPVVHAIQAYNKGVSAKLLPGAKEPQAGMLPPHPLPPP